MKWLLILMCIIGFYSNSYSQNKEVYSGTWKGTSQWITTEIVFKDSGNIQVTFSLKNTFKYIERKGTWRVKEKIAEIFLNYEETQDYILNIKKIDKCYKSKFTLIGVNKGILIDNNASIYTVYKIFDKQGNQIKHLRKKI